MSTSIQFLSSVIMMLAAGSFFWVYKTTSSSVFQPRRGDRRVAVRPEGNERRSQAENTVWNSVEYWAHRGVWLFVAAASMVVFAKTFGPGIGLI